MVKKNHFLVNQAEYISSKYFNKSMFPKKKIKNLSLGGGGFYGYAEVGALKELEKYGKYLDIKNIKGVSVGSMVAALYAIGYTPDEMSEILIAKTILAQFFGMSIFSSR